MARNPTYGDISSLQSLIDNASDATVKQAFSAGVGLRDFLAGIDVLSTDERRTIVDQAITLIENFYVHLPLKRAMYAIDPLQRLRLLRRRLPQLQSELAFHHEMTEIFTSLRDLHTNYLLPAAFGDLAAFLPFRVAACYVAGQRQYIVCEIAPGLQHEFFERGVRLVYWNGIPIDRAVEIAASYHAGSNPAARHARGVEGLTKRAMTLAPPPDEEWVIVGYVGHDGVAREFRTDWTITGLPGEPEAATATALPEASAALGVDIEGEMFGRINKMLYAQDVISKTREIQPARAAARARATNRTGSSAQALDASSAATEVAEAAQAVQGTASILPDFLEAKAVTSGDRSFAYVRIRKFGVNDDVFVHEFLRLITLPQMPQEGLIIDVRGNPGGLIWAGERLLQLLTPRTIEPCRVQLINTALNVELASKLPMLAEWFPSLERAGETGAAFSAAFPITPPARCNDIGQRYYGRVVLITDARCYSTTDFFAAGFKDHGIGTILGVDDNTGAGGANVWTYDQLRQFFTAAGLPAPLQPLPKGAGMRVAFRRTLRVGPEAGTELEDLGVKPDEPHQYTVNDALNHNEDLIAHAADILARKSPCKFIVQATRLDAKVNLRLTTAGVDYVDVMMDRRPRGSRNVVDSEVQFELPDDTFTLPAGQATFELRGYAADQLVCFRRLSA